MRLHRIIEKDGKVVPWKGVGVAPYHERPDLVKYGITEARYFRVESSERPPTDDAHKDATTSAPPHVIGDKVFPFAPRDPAAQLPEEFFEGIDAVHIASPNQFHSSQTVQCLEHEKTTVTEKTLATTREDFDAVLKFIVENGHTDRFFPHLHYLGKALTRTAPSIASDLTQRYGRIRRAVATFFEWKEDDLRRRWLFQRQNGGVFMDWAHASAVIAHICNATFEDCYDPQLYAVNPELDPANATGATAKFKVSGDIFTSNAEAVVNVAKGLPRGTSYKHLRLHFEKNAMLDLSYVGSDQEYNLGLRGSWRTVELDGPARIVKEGEPKGPVSYEIMVQNLVTLIETGKPPLSMDEVKRLYEPQWLFQEAAEGMKAVADEASVKRFIAKYLTETIKPDD